MVGIINNHIALPKAVLTGRRLLIMAKEKKRTDSYRRVLRQGESQRANGKYDYRWTDKLGKRHSIYADTLDELREKED